MGNFYAGLAELLEVEAIDPGKELDSYENWDSLTVLTLIAMLDADFGVNMTAKEIAGFKTAGELYVELKRKKHK